MQDEEHARHELTGTAKLLEESIPGVVFTTSLVRAEDDVMDQLSSHLQTLGGVQGLVVRHLLLCNRPAAKFLLLSIAVVALS